MPSIIQNCNNCNVKMLTTHYIIFIYFAYHIIVPLFEKYYYLSLLLSYLIYAKIFKLFLTIIIYSF